MINSIYSLKYILTSVNLSPQFLRYGLDHFIKSAIECCNSNCCSSRISVATRKVNKYLPQMIAYFVQVYVSSVILV